MQDLQMLYELKLRDCMVIQPCHFHENKTGQEAHCDV